MHQISWLPSQPEEAASAISAFAGYAKIQGILLAKSFGLPNLQTVVIDPASITPAELSSFLLKWPYSSSFLLRHDRSPEIGHSPQGGYVIEGVDLPTELKWYESEGRLVLLLEPAHPLKNKYSGSVAITANNIAEVELVGPGFDASDLNRGFINPQERHRYLLSPGERPQAIDSEFVDFSAYQEMKQLRLRKIALKYLSRHHFISVDSIDLATAKRQAIESSWAASQQVAHLLDSAPYVPAPPSFIRRLLNFVEIILAGLDLRSGLIAAFAASQIDNGMRDVVWDIVLADRKYSLSKVRHGS